MDFSKKNPSVPVQAWIGTSKEKNPTVVDGKTP